jgi:hypothetical protein
MNEQNKKILRLPRLFIEGHSVKHGYIISRDWSVEECRAAADAKDFSHPEPIRFIRERDRAFRLVVRFNAIQTIREAALA